MQGVVWITGLSGAGKTTVAAAVRDRLVHSGIRPVLLDGDRIRRLLPAEPGFEPAARRRLAQMYSGLAAEIAAQHHLVICSTISLFHDVHAWNRRHLPAYVEVLLRVPMAELRLRRDREALYPPAGSATDPARRVVGVDIAAEFPLSPDLVIDNFADVTAERAAELIERALAERQASPATTTNDS